MFRPSNSMYGYQGNNSHSYNYQNQNSSFGNFSHNAGPYHTYYSNATGVYNSYPSNDTPCSSLGIIPQEYNQGDNGNTRPYFCDANTSYPRSYQGLPFNQSRDPQSTNPFNVCPRECHCCEPLKTKYFNSGTSGSQQSNIKYPFASLSSLKKNFDSSNWREYYPQMPNLKDISDSSTSWSKFSSSYRNETYSWPIPQRQNAKFESTERLGLTNDYSVSQQHQRVALTNNQTYSNSMQHVPTSWPSSGSPADILRSSIAGYQHNSIPDLAQSNSVSHASRKISVNPIQTSSITAYNLPYGSSFTCKYSTSQPSNNNPKCIVETSKMIVPVSDPFVDSFQGHFVTKKVRENIKDNSYHQSGLLPPPNLINPQTKRGFCASNESDLVFQRNCNSIQTNDPVAASKLQLPPIQSLRPSTMHFRHSSREYYQDHSHPILKCSQQNMNEEVSAKMRKGNLSDNPSLRNSTTNTDKLHNLQTENLIKTHTSEGSNANLMNKMYWNHCMEKLDKDSMSDTRLGQGCSKVKAVENTQSKLSSSTISSGISDLRHFLSTWDDVDEEDMPNSVQDVVSEGDKDNVGSNSEEISIVTDHPLHEHLLSGNPICKVDVNGDFSIHETEQKGFLIEGVTYPVDSSQFLGHYFESDLFSKTSDLNDSEIKEYKSNTVTKKVKNEFKDSKGIAPNFQATRSVSISELSSSSECSDNVSSNHSSSLVTEKHDCKSCLDVNASEVGHIKTQILHSKEKDTLKKKEYKEILHSADGTSLKILSRDLGVQGPSVNQNRSNAYQIPSSIVSPKNDKPILQKTFFTPVTKSDENILNQQNMIIKETETGITPLETGSIGLSNSANKENKSSESDTMVVYNLTARVDVTLKRLEVPSDPIHERNDFTTHIFKQNSQKEKESSEIGMDECTSSDMNWKILKGNGQCAFVPSMSQEVSSHMVKETDHIFEAIGSPKNCDESFCKTEVSVIDQVKKHSLVLPAISDRNSVDKKNRRLGVDLSSERGSLFGCKNVHVSKDTDLVIKVHNFHKDPQKGSHKSLAETSMAFETEIFKEVVTLTETQGIPVLQNKDTNGQIITLPSFSNIHEFEKKIMKEEVNNVREASFEEIGDNMKHINEEAVEHIRSLLGSNGHLKEFGPTVEKVNSKEMLCDYYLPEKIPLTNVLPENVISSEVVTEDKEKSEMQMEEEEHECLIDNESYSLKINKPSKKVESHSKHKVEEFDGHSKLFIKKNPVLNFKGSIADSECLYISDMLGKDNGELNFKFSHTCRKRKAKKVVQVIKSKSSRNQDKNCTSKFYMKTACKAILSIRKKYHIFHLRKNKKKGYAKIMSKTRLMNKNTKIKDDLSVIHENAIDLDAISNQSEAVLKDDGLISECFVVNENDSLSNSCLSSKIIKHEGLVSSQYICCSDNNRESEEVNAGGVILNVEDKEIVMEGLRENCVIGNVEVFMGLETGEGITMEESVKESSYTLGPPIEELLHEDNDGGVQYWNGYELDNSLGVAMEVEVGSEMESDVEMIMSNHVKEENISDSKGNKSTGCLTEGRHDLELLETFSHDGVRNKKKNLLDDSKKEIGTFHGKREAGSEYQYVSDNAKSISFYEGENDCYSDSTDCINRINVNLEYDNEIKTIKSTKISSPRDILMLESDSNKSHIISLTANKVTEEGNNLVIKGETPADSLSFTKESKFSNGNIKLYSLSSCKGSFSKTRKLNKNCKNKGETISKKGEETNNESFETCAPRRKESLIEKGSSAYFLTSEVKILQAGDKRPTTKISFESNDNQIGIGEALVEEFPAKRYKLWGMHGNVVDSAISEERKHVKSNRENVISECTDYESGIDAHSEINRNDVEKNHTHCGGNFKDDSGGYIQKLNVKLKKREKLRFSSGRTIKNYVDSRSRPHKFTKNGFWRVKKWPYNFIVNKSKPQKILPKIHGQSFSSLEAKSLPLILKSYPHPPFLSPLPTITDTHNLSLTSSKPSSEKYNNEEYNQLKHTQCSSEQLCSNNESAISSYITENSNHSEISLPVTNSDSTKSKIQQCFPLPITKYESIEQNISTEAEFAIGLKCSKSLLMHCDSPNRLSINDQGVTSKHREGSECMSNVSTNPRVCITLKKVEATDRNEMWIKTTSENGCSENEVRKENSYQNMIDYSLESPLPKVTIKKKHGEGYQSFLSGFSSYSPHPAASVISAPNTLMHSNSEDSFIEKQQVLNKKIISSPSQISKAHLATEFLKSKSNAVCAQEVFPQKNSSAFDEVQSGILEKKAGSGLVFVIRGFGNRAKEDHPEEFVEKQKHISCRDMETSDKGIIGSNIPENCLSSEDEELESIAWSIWQPVVKLSRSCELDALARELCNTDEDSLVGDNSGKLHNYSKPPGNKILLSPLNQRKNIEFECMTLKPMKDFVHGRDTTERKHSSTRKNIENFEIENKLSTVFRSTSVEHPRELDFVSHKKAQKVLCEKSFDAALKQIEEVEEKKMQLEKGKISGNMKVLKESLKPITYLNGCEKHSKQSLLPIPQGTIKSAANLHDKRSEELDVSAIFRKEKATRVPREHCTEKEKQLDSVKNKYKSSVKGMNLSKECKKYSRLECMDDQERKDIQKEVQNGNKKVLSNLQDLQSKEHSKEKLFFMSSCSDDNHNMQNKKCHTPIFQCEACCRKFSSEKWLSRHCKGVSHIRVENAQRVAVQALLLLLTGDESKSLRPLSELELANLRIWSSCSAPSPLQVALKELLHPTKDHIK